MDPQSGRLSEAETRELASDLLHQGQRLALGGWLAEAGAVLEQSWAVAGSAASDLANSAAWDAGWLAARRGRYAEAGTWFGRMTGPPACEGESWSAARAALVDLCLAQVGPPGSRARAATSPLAPVSPARLRVHNLGRFQVFRDE